ncbi:MAG: LLM class flavin-dependent oxidoreductase [Acidimicrobiia bacterium]
MEVGFGLISCQRYPGDGRSWTELYAEALELAAAADRLGFSSVWTTEHHFVDDGYMPSLLVTSAAIAARTSSIRIGTGLLLAPLYEPLRLAEDAATVDLISRGRLVLGLGLGWSEIEFEAFDASTATRGRAMTEILQILPQAWSGHPVQHQGGVYHPPPVALRPLPQRRIPIWVGGRAEPAIRRAARLADGFLSNASPEGLRKQVEIARDEQERAGRDEEDFAWAHYQMTYPCDDPDRGWEEVRPYVWHMRWKYRDMQSSAARVGDIPAAPPLDGETEQRLRSTVLMGTGHEIAARVLETRAAAGVELEFIARSYFPGMPFGQQTELLHRIAEEVMPHLA